MAGSEKFWASVSVQHLCVIAVNIASKSVLLCAQCAMHWLLLITVFDLKHVYMAVCTSIWLPYVCQGAHEMILEMVGWRDPNMVPIKAFYGDDLKVNYCGKLATDHHLHVSRAAAGGSVPV